MMARDTSASRSPPRKSQRSETPPRRDRSDTPPRKDRSRSRRRGGSRSRKRSASRGPPRRRRSPSRRRANSRSRSPRRRGRSRSRGGRGGRGRKDDNFDYGTSGIIVQTKASGFGFIKPDTANDDDHNLYFHASGCGGGNSFDSFRVRDRVLYEVGTDERRGQTIAKNIRFDR